MLESVSGWLFDPSGLTPHGFCLLWEPSLIWTYVASDAAIALSYFTIALLLARFAHQRRDLVLRPLFVLFASFILLCGATHVASLLTIWVPAYGLEGILKAGTAAASAITAVAAWRLLPTALALPSHAQVQAANEVLREDKARVQAKYAHTPLPLHVLDAAGLITAVSDRWLDLLGYRREEVIGAPITAFQASAPAADSRHPISISGESLDVPRRYVRYDGAILEVLESARQERTSDGSLHTLGGLSDVTALVQSEKALRKSEQRARLALAAVNSAATWDWDTANDRLYGDVAFARIFGIDPARAEAGAPLAAYFARLPPADRAGTISDYERTMRIAGDHSIVHPVMQADRSIRWFLAKSHATLAADGSPLRMPGVLIDITEQRAVEAQLRQSQKMEAVGQLTGGLAHDFNNMLQSISGSLELLKMQVDQGRPENLSRYIALGQGSANRAATLTQRLLAFSRRQMLTPETVTPDSLIREMVELIQRTVGPAIRVTAIPTPGVWNTLCDASQMENALLNLCINARDAMPDGGRLTIETANTVLEGRAAGERDMQPGEYVAVCVTDTGIGMSPDIVARAFDPFFTTKPPGAGTGLGLSMIHGFANQSGGQAIIHSKVGIGTTVRIFLPRHIGTIAARPVSVEAHDMPRAEAGQTVLVVDDEPTVRILIAEVLQRQGYKTIEATDGAAGLRVLRSQERIDLLVSDVGLPGGMNGRQMADAALVGRPNLKVLFVTGYAPNAVFGDGLLTRGTEVMTKPFTADALAIRVKAMVASP